MKLSLNTELLDDFSNIDLLLLDYLAKSTKEGQPSNSTIKKEMRISVNTILKSLEKLQKQELIHIENPSRTVRIITVTEKGNEARKTSSEVVSHELTEEEQKVVNKLSLERAVLDEEDYYTTSDYSVVLDDKMVQWTVKALYENIEMLISKTVVDNHIMKRNGVMFARVEMLFSRLELAQRLYENFDIEKKISLMNDLLSLTQEVQRVSFFTVNDVSKARTLLRKIEEAVESN